MDYLSQKFVAFLQELREDLKAIRQLLSSLNEGTQEQIKLIGNARQDSKAPEFILRAELNVPEVQQRAEITYKNQQARLQLWNVVIAALTLLAVAAYAVVSYWQLHEIHRTSVVSNRAWVGLNGPVVLKSFTKGEKIMIEATMRNFGPALALHTVNWAAATEDENHLETVMNSVCRNSFTVSHGIFAKDINNPSLGSILSQPYGQSLFPGEIFENNYESVEPEKKAHEAYAFVVGCIWYRDQFGEERRTRYCSVSPKTLKESTFPIELRACNIYNDAD